MKEQYNRDVLVLSACDSKLVLSASVVKVLVLVNARQADTGSEEPC